MHLTSYPVADESLMDEELETSIAAVIRLKNLALHLRTQSKVKVRQPLSVLTIRPKDEQERKVLENEKYAAQILKRATSSDWR